MEQQHWTDFWINLCLVILVLCIPAVVYLMMKCGQICPKCHKCGRFERVYGDRDNAVWIEKCKFCDHEKSEKASKADWDRTHICTGGLFG